MTASVASSLRASARASGAALGQSGLEFIRLFLFLPFFLGDFWASPSPPNVRVARGEGQPPRASARGPARGGGQIFVEIYFRSGCGGQPESGPRRPKRPGPLPPFFCAARLSAEATQVPGTSYPIAGVWGARIWCSGSEETVCTALRPRALVRQALLRDRAEEPAVGAHPSSLTPTPYPGPSSSLRRAPLTALLELTPVRLLTQIKALAQGLSQTSPRCCIVHRGNSNVPRISPHRQQGQVALRQFCRWWHCEPYPIGVA